MKGGPEKIGSSQRVMNKQSSKLNSKTHEVTHETGAYNTNAWEVEANRSGVQGQLRLAQQV